jgi:hypothetical protein
MKKLIQAVVAVACLSGFLDGRRWTGWPSPGAIGGTAPTNARPGPRPALLKIGR